MKTQFNVRFLIGLLAVLVVVGSAVVLVHACQFGPESTALLAEANRAETAGDRARAADYLQRRLAFTPEDMDILERYGRTLAETAHTSSEQERVLSVYEDVLAREPTRHDLRRAAADLALELGRFDRAGNHLERLAHYRPDDGEVQDLLGQCRQALGDTERAESAYRAAVKLAPDRVGAYVRLAGLLRGSLNRPSEADQVMDDLVTANDHAFAAYLERAAYLTANGALEDAEKDAARARELAPDDARMMLTAADLAARRGRIDESRAALRRGLKLHADDMNLRLGLATLELKTARPKEAAECLEEERRILQDRKPAPDEFELVNLLAEARLQLGETAAVDDLAAEMRKAGSLGAAQYLAARVQMHDGRWGEAARALEDSAKASVLSVDQAVRTLLCLGVCYEHLGDGDRRLGVLREAVGFAPWSAPAGAAMGAALLDAGRTDEALDQLRRTTQLPQAPEETWALLGRALLLHAQTLPANRQDWREVDRVLDRCGTTAEAARLRAAALRARGEAGQATTMLEQARTAHPDQPAAWTALALDAARRGDAAGAASVLAEARRRLGDRVEFRLAALEACAGAEDESAFKALSDLEKGLDGYAPGDRTLVLCRVAETYYRAGKTSDGDRLCRLLAAEPATDLSGRLPLLTAVLSSEDDGLMDAVLADVVRLEGEGGAWHQYGRAARLAIHAYRGDRGGLGEAKALLTDLAHRRPDWSRVALLQGQIAELEGDAAGAVDGYQRAFDLGERRPDVAQTLVRMLANRGRWDDADQVLRKFQEEMVFHGALARQAAEVALRTHNGERAVEMARLAAPADDAYAYHVWLGRVLASAGRPDEAADELRRAVHSPNAGWDATAALAAHLTQQGRRAEAEAAVEELKASLPPRYAALPLAMCYEAAGRLDLAERDYDAALALRPDDGPTLVRVAAFDLRLNRAARAEAVLRHLLDSGKDASVSDLAWARRELAMVLASAGDDRKCDEAATLLGAGPKPGEDAAAFRRAQAFVLAGRAAGRPEALRRLEEESKAGSLPTDEQFRLARLYDADGQWPEARERLVTLITTDQQNPEYLASLIDGLLRHDQAEEAGSWLARLETLEPGAARVQALRARMATRDR